MEDDRSETRPDVPTIRETDGGDEMRSLKTYVSDMLALERHIAEPFKRQRDDADVQKFPEARQIAIRLDAIAQQHILALENCLNAMGGHAASPIKSIWSNLLGQAASAIDKARRTEVSKDLRDDYTAISLATVSYSMLQATALAYNERQVEELARRAMSDYAGCIMDLGRAVPAVTIDELAHDGLAVDSTVRGEAIAAVEDLWRSQSAGGGAALS